MFVNEGKEEGECAQKHNQLLRCPAVNTADRPFVQPRVQYVFMYLVDERFQQPS